MLKECESIEHLVPAPSRSLLLTGGETFDDVLAQVDDAGGCFSSIIADAVPGESRDSLDALLLMLDRGGKLFLSEEECASLLAEAHAARSGLYSVAIDRFTFVECGDFMLFTRCTGPQEDC